MTRLSNPATLAEIDRGSAMNDGGSLSVGNPVWYVCSHESMMKQDEAVLKISAFSHKPVTWPSLGGGTRF